MRHEWTDRNPITKVRTSAKRLRETNILTPAEFAALLPELKVRERTMVILAGNTGLRRSELVALTWADIDLELMQVNVRRSCVRSRFGETKTEASRRPVPLHPSVARALAVWKEETLYKKDADFLFPSVRLNGKKPVTPDMVLKKSIRPALLRAGITDKVIGWHSFRHHLPQTFARLESISRQHKNSFVTPIRGSRLRCTHGRSPRRSARLTIG